MKRRLSFLLALLQIDCKLIAFDECSTGLSPDLKIIVWNVISLINEQFKKSCIITTHYMDEIEALAQNMVVLKDGKVQIEQRMSNMISDLDSNVVVYEDDERAYNVSKREHV